MRTVPRPEWLSIRDVIVIDCPAKFADSSSAAIRVADFVLVPVQPSPFDVWASDAVAGLIKTRQEATGGAPLAAYAISRAISNTSLQRSIGAALEGYGLPVLKAGTTQRGRRVRGRRLGRR